MTKIGFMINAYEKSNKDVVKVNALLEYLDIHYQLV